MGYDPVVDAPVVSLMQLRRAPVSDVVQRLEAIAAGTYVADADASGPELHVVADLDEAWRFAFEVDERPLQEHWCELRELARSDLKGQLAHESGGWDSAGMLLPLQSRDLDRLAGATARRLGLGADFVAELYVDYQGIVMAAKCGADAPAVDLFQQLFRAYQCGWFPCGWLGEYPSGRLVVWRRPDGSSR